MKFSTPHGHDFFHGHGFFQHGFFSRHDLYDESGIHRGILAAVGVLFMFLGLLGFGMVTVMTLASVMVFGTLAIVGGIVQLAASFTSHGRRNILAGALLGLIYILAGIVVINNPVASSMMLTLFLAGALIALGVLRVVFWMEHRSHRYWMWSVVSGIVSLVLGFLIIAQWPLTGFWVIGLFVSLEMIFHGAAALGLSLEKGSLI